MNSDFKAGSKIGNYVLESYLGGGSFGAVWRCRDETTGELAAIKLLTGALSSSETAGMRAEVEMLAAFASSRSEHVVHILGGGPDPVPYVVMEYIEGSDFQSLLKDQRGLPQERTIEAGIAIADALRALNEAGIIHRDIKPANVMIDKDGEIKLTDFGIAKIVGYETMTMTGQAAMTMAYAAPEIWDEGSAFGRASHKSDLYAMGILLFQCLTGVTPFRGNYGALYKAHTERPPDINMLPADTSPSLRALIVSCLQKKQADRPADAEACLLALQRASVELQERTGKVPEGEPTRFGPWLRAGIHETMPWAWRSRHETTGTESTVEVHFADSLEYGGQLRKAVAANSKLATLGAERLLETNRLLPHPDQAWIAAPAGPFQFWIAREDRRVDPASRVTPAILSAAATAVASLIEAAAAEGVTLKLRDSLSVLDSGEVYMRRPAIDVGTANPEHEALELLRGLPLDPEAAALVSAAPDLQALLQNLSNPQDTGATMILPKGVDQTVVVASQTVVIGREEAVAAPLTPIVAAAPALGLVAVNLRRIHARAAASDYDLSLHNNGPSPIDLDLAASDQGGRLAFSLANHVTVQAGGTERVSMRVKPRSLRWFGGKSTTRFAIVTSGGAGDSEPPITTFGEFEDEPSRAPLLAGGGLFGIAVLAVGTALALGGGSDDSNAAVAVTETATAVTATATSIPPNLTAVSVPEPAPPEIVPPPAEPVQPAIEPQPQPQSRPPTQPVVIAPVQPALAPPPPPPPTSTPVPVRPSITITCTSASGGRGTSTADTKGSMSVVANETVTCSAAITGQYNFLEWHGGQAPTSRGTSFTTSFAFSRTPTSMTILLNWGDNRQNNINLDVTTR